MQKTTVQIAVWSPGPSDRDEDRLFLTIDPGDGTLMARIERDRLDTATGRLISTAEEVPPEAILEMQEPSLFAQKMLDRLLRLLD
jgi:hypothetical protein